MTPEEADCITGHSVVKRKKYNSYIREISPGVDNLTQRDFHADKPNEKWLTDITEFHIPAGKIYLSPIFDCFDGLAVSWSIGTSPNADLVNSMLYNAVSLLDENEHPIVHSDRGGHYRWPGWIQRMDEILNQLQYENGMFPNETFRINSHF
jgi:transposase InsO family protein